MGRIENLTQLIATLTTQIEAAQDVLQPAAGAPTVITGYPFVLVTKDGQSVISRDSNRLHLVSVEAGSLGGLKHGLHLGLADARRIAAEWNQMVVQQYGTIDTASVEVEVKMWREALTAILPKLVAWRHELQAMVA